MSFRKAIGGKISAGNKSGKIGYGAATGGKIRRWAGTIPTAYWRVNGIAASSTTLPDASKAGLGLDGTLGGAVDTEGADATWNTTTTAPGSYQSLRLNGVDNKVVVPYNAALKPSNTTLSIAMWINTDSSNKYLLSAEGDDAAGPAGWVYCGVGVNPGGRAEVYWNNTGAGWKSSTTVVNDSNWHHLVYVYDSSATNEIRSYVDGVLEVENGSQSGNFTLNDVSILIGYRLVGGAKYYRYYLDEIAYWTDVALTEKQVQSLYNEGKTLNSYAGIQRA